MTTNKSLDLEDGPRTRVFRQLEQILRNDATLRRVIGKNWKTFSGDPGDAIPFPVAACPWIVMSRIPGAENFWSPDAMTGELSILLAIGIKGFCEDDADNLYTAIQRAIYPVGDQSAKLANVQLLQKAGAHTGIVTFTQPAFDPRSLDGQACDGTIQARGRLTITVRNTF
jgi:hypothetical protein